MGAHINQSRMEASRYIRSIPSPIFRGSQGRVSTASQVVLLDQETNHLHLLSGQLNEASLHCLFLPFASFHLSLSPGSLWSHILIKHLPLTLVSGLLYEEPR